MKALKVYVRPKNKGFEVDYQEIIFEEQRRGLRGLLGIEKVIPPGHLTQAFYEPFDTLEAIAANVVERFKFGYQEVHATASNPYLAYSLRRKIKQIELGIKIANPFRAFRLSFEQLLRIIPRLDEYFKNINK